jgi:dihydroorotase
VVGLETLLPISLGLYHDGSMPLLDVIDRLTLRPATILGLEAGSLRVGAPASMVIFDLERAVRIDAARFRSKSKNSPFDGKPAQGRVWRTVYRGRTVFDVDAGPADPRARREPAHA